MNLEPIHAHGHTESTFDTSNSGFPSKNQGSNENFSNKINYSQSDAAVIHTAAESERSENISLTYANDKSNSPPTESVPTILYLKKVANSGLQSKTNAMKSSQEPIPKLIVSTKSIKLTNQYDQSSDSVRYVTALRKSISSESSDSPVNKLDGVKSTKIIIKGITSQDKRLMVCESPTQDSSYSPQSSPKLSPPPVIPQIEFSKTEAKVSTVNEESAQNNEENMDTSDNIGDINEACQPGTHSTPKTNREMKHLHKTMKESKMLTDLATVGGDAKDRRIKRKFDETDESEMIDDSLEASHSQTNLTRSRSTSPSRDSCDKMISIRRYTRSLNAEFSAKQKKFLAGIQKHSRGSDDDRSEDEPGSGRKKISKKSGKLPVPLKPGYDKYCWQCHQNNTQIACAHCKRTYHTDCLKPKQVPISENQKLTWQCPECYLLENSMKEAEKPLYDFNELCTMLEFAYKRLKLTSKNLLIPSESDNIVNTVNFSTMEQKLNDKQYASTHSFLTDARWILHNCTIIYSRNAKLLTIAKAIFKVCKQEIYDIDTCHECYYNANTCKTDWFVEVCSRPHILVWAKLKGFPYWPAKAMTTNSQGMVDVRFFGDHDRSLVPIRECYLYSENHPNPITVKSKRQSIAHSVVEVNMYIEKLTAKFGSFVYPKCKTLYEPFKEDEQLEQMIPNYRNYKNNLANKKSTSNSDLTYKIVKTADNNLSIVKKNDKIVLPESKKNEKTVISPESKSNEKSVPPTESIKKTDKTVLPTELVNDKTKHTERKHRRNSSIERQNDLNDDLSYQIMKPNRDGDASRLDGRVDSMILKRKSDNSPVTGEMRKKLKLLADDRRPSTPTGINESSSFDDRSNDAIDKLSIKRKVTKNHDEEKSARDEIKKRTERKLTSKSVKDMAGKSNSKEDLISSVVKKLDTLQAFVSTIDNSKRESISNSNKINDQEGRVAKNLNSTSGGDKHMAVISQRTEQSNANRVSETRTDNKNDEDENLLVPMHDRSVSEICDSKKEIQMAAITSSRQGSMSGSSVQSVAGSLDDPLEITIKSEPLSGDERVDSIPSYDASSETILPPKENQMKGAGQECNFAKITVKNINTMTKPMRQMQKPHVGVRKMPLGKTVLRPDVIKPRARKSFMSNLKIASQTTDSSMTPNIQQQQNSQLKQSQNMVCIPMDRSSFQRIESIMLGNQMREPSTYTKCNPPPLAAVSATPSVTVLQKEQIAQSKNMTNTSVSSLGPPPLSLTSPMTSEQISVVSNIVQPIQQSTISGTITDTFASTITDIMKLNEPKLTPKPIGPLRFDGTNQLTSEAGHYSKMLIDNSHKFADFFRSVFEVTLADIASMGCSEARIQLLELELEQCKLNHTKELEDLKSSTTMLLGEMKKNFEAEKFKLINETRRQCEIDRIRAVEDTKKRQWCANCGKEAKFYCCWNTSYCDYPCQQQHWPRHMSNCSQTDEFRGTNPKPIGAKVLTNKGKELNQSQASTLVVRQFANSNIKNIASGNPRANQSLQRVISLSQTAKNNATAKNTPTQKFVGRMNTCVMLPSTTSISNANVNPSNPNYTNSSSS